MNLTSRCTIFLALFPFALFARSIFFVVPTDPPPPADEMIRLHLQDQRHVVTLGIASNINSGDAAGYDLVMVSESVSSSDVGDKFNTISIPVLSMEPYIYDNLGMTTAEETAFGRDETGMQNILITNSAHALAAGKSGNVQVYSEPGSFGWGVPGDNASKIAALTSDNSKAVIFAYELGASLPGNFSAQERRVGFFLFGNQSGKLTQDGWDLFDAAMRWATYLEPSSDVKSPFETIANAYRLEQNYPNPFNPATTISYSLQKAARVRLSVFDIRGREIAVITDEIKNAGNHDAVFDGANLPSGTYIYIMQAEGGYKSVRKMVLLR